jgi:uncharacterized metal-binding protein YceD (DUF177 family)
MNSQSFYNIAFRGLSQGKHTFEYEVGTKFFSEFDGGVVEEGDVNVCLTLEKQSALMILTFDFEGKVSVQCDRCLEIYDQPIEGSDQVFVKFGEKEFEDGDEVIWVGANDNQLNVAQLIYEFICLAVPIKRIHPIDKNGNSTCDPEMIEKLDRYIIKNEGETNPLWNDLKKLLNNE